LPNAGKSTLLNRLVGQKLAITSPKPQTTRNRVVGILVDGDAQIVLLDAPGLLEPGDELRVRMQATAVRALRDADIIVHVTDAARGVPRSLAETTGATIEGPVLVALNKIDLVTPASREQLRAALPDAIQLSAATGDGVPELLRAISAAVPTGPWHYGADDVATQPTRFFAAELVREAAFEQLDDEVPHAVACVIEEFREERSPVYIRATLFVERESQKRILIGADGGRIRELGRAARLRIEALLDAPVYLDLWVKVEPHWRREPHVLDRLGYSRPE
jgi:GTP-binding protein Era